MPALRIFAILAASATLAAQPGAAQVTVVPSETVAQRLLDAQNAERARLGLRSFTWSAKLAEHARKWAQTLATSDMFEHSPVGADGGEGENLWYGTKSDYSPEEIIGFFIDEGHQFKRGTFPAVSTTGRWEDVGHYSQLVWSDTREVGCAIVGNARRDFLVCRYWPAGNIRGRAVYDYAATRAAVAPPTVPRPAVDEVVETVTTESPAVATVASPAKVSPSGPKKRASKRRRRGG